MTRRKLFSLLLAITLAGPVLADDDVYLAGANFRELSQRLPRAGTGAGKIEVIEFFWYGCPHCYALEPYIETWLKSGIPADASFVRVPAALNPTWRVHAKAYYVAESLGVLDKTHRALFDAIHQGGKSLSDQASLREFFVEHGVGGAEFDAAWDSYAVEAKLRRAESLAQTAGLDGVPTMVVDGRYLTTVTLAGGREELLRVVNYLVNLARESNAKDG
jgi:protein dithiol oxidoreductase (disulfide-forming)